jgi:nucleoside-diphosphate-sugar epimerase
VKRIILISFPHVEGETFIDNPAYGKLDGNPESVHAKTRLEEEKLLFTFEKETKMEAVSLRVGMVYGKGILMIDAAKWFAKYKLLGIWKKPTWIHLISTIDFLNATQSAILKDEIHGIYHIGDEGQQTLQEFLDTCSTYWGYKKPWHMPLGLIMFAARIFEMSSFIFGTRSPLTRDFVKIGTASYYGDTSRMRTDLLQELTYKTFREGMSTL